jgi:dTDP-4-dehydrorhamnose 3,5-epimerase
MRRIDTELDGVCILEPVVHGDRRGFFMETYNRQTFAEIGIVCDFVQDNYSRSRRGVLRGLHYQIRHTQAKLVRVTRGEVYDTAVDLRRGSATFGRYVGATLSEENQRMLFVPEGFAHGFYVLSEVAEFAYKCSDFYTPQHERGIIWNDPGVAIAWPLQGEPVLSDRDTLWPALSDVPPRDLFDREAQP